MSLTPETRRLIDRQGLERQGRFEELESALRSELTTMEAGEGLGSKRYRRVVHEFVTFLLARKRFPEAEQEARRLAELARQDQGEAGYETLEALGATRDAVVGQGQLAEAESLQRKILTLKGYNAESGDRSVIFPIQDIGILRDLLKAQGRLAEAERLQLHIVEWCRRVRGDHAANAPSYWLSYWLSHCTK